MALHSVNVPSCTGVAFRERPTNRYTAGSTCVRVCLYVQAGRQAGKQAQQCVWVPTVVTFCSYFLLLPAQHAAPCQPACFDTCYLTCSLACSTTIARLTNTAVLTDGFAMLSFTPAKGGVEGEAEAGTLCAGQKLQPSSYPVPSLSQGSVQDCAQPKNTEQQQK